MSEEANWRQLIDADGPALLLLARQYARNTQEAEDALQEGLLRTWQRRFSANDLRGFAFACVRNAAIDLGRSQRRRELREGKVRAAATQVWLAKPAEQSETQAHLELALQGLPEEQREVVVMKIWGGLSFAQIGVALSVPLNTAASRYRYALEQLRESLSVKEQP